MRTTRLELGSLAGYAFLMHVHALRAVMVDRDVRGLGDDQIDVAVQSAVDVDVALPSEARQAEARC